MMPLTYAWRPSVNVQNGYDIGAPNSANPMDANAFVVVATAPDPVTAAAFTTWFNSGGTPGPITGGSFNATRRAL